MSLADVLDATFCAHLTLALVHFLWQGLAIAVMAAAAAHWMRRAPARNRYLVYLLALLLMAACLPVTFAVVAMTGPERGPPVTETVSARPAGSVDGGAPSASPVHVEPAPSMPATAAAADAPAGSGIAGSEPSPSGGSPAFAWDACARFVTMGYLVGVVALLGRLLIRLRGGKRLCRSAQPIDQPGLGELITRQARLLGLRLVPTVAFCRRVAAPVVVGVLRPTILLPISLSTGLTPDQIRIVLLHELAHIRRYDHLVNVIQQLVEALLFFHPAVWYVSRRLSTLREYCCDDMVLGAGEKRCEYAESLVRVAELGVRWRPAARVREMAAPAFSSGKPSRLRSRIVRLLGHPEAPQVRFTPGGTLAVTLVLGGGLCLALALLRPAARADTEKPDEGRQQAAAATDEEPGSQPGDRLHADLPGGGRVELLGLIRSDDKASGWWAADGSPTTVPEVLETELKDLGTIAAFRVTPGDVRLTGYFLKASSMLSFKETWRASGEGIVLVAIDHPEGRRFGNLWLDLRGRPGKRLHTFPLAADDAGKVRRVDQFQIRGFADLKATGPSQFTATVLHDYRLPRSRLAAADEEDRLHVPSVEDRRQGASESTSLTFDFPLDRVTGIVLWEPSYYGVATRNVALMRGVKARPMTVVRYPKEPETAVDEVRPGDAQTAFRAELPGGGFAQLLGVARYTDEGLTWWAPDGGAMAGVAGILESDVEGYGTVVATRSGGAGYGSRVFMEREEKRLDIEGAAYVEPVRAWLWHLDPTGSEEEAVLVFDMLGGEPKTVLTVPITAADMGQEKAVDQGVIDKLSNLEPLTPEQFRVTIDGRVRARGMEFVALDKAGEPHGYVASSGYAYTFPFPIEELAAVAVTQKTEHAEIRFAGISLQPGRRTDLTIETKELPPLEIPSLPPPRTAGQRVASANLPVSGRVTDAASGKPIEWFTIIPGRDSHGDGNRFFDWDKAKRFRDGQYAFIIQKPNYATEPPDLTYFLRVEAEGYPAAVSRAFQPSEDPATFDFELRADAGITGVVEDGDGTPLADAAVAVALKSRWLFINDNEAQRDTNTMVLFTDSQGRFAISEDDDAHGVVVIHDRGFAASTIEDLRRTGRLVARPWARVEGVFKIGPKPGPGQTIQLDIAPFPKLGRGYQGNVQLTYRGYTDESGRFEFPRVPGLPGRIGRQLIIKHDPEGGYMSTTGPALNVELEPGRTHTVNLGGSGRAAVGRIRVPGWYTAPVDYSWGSGHLKRIEPAPPYPPGLTTGEQRDWYETWKQTDAGRAYWLDERWYGFLVEPDGSFRLPDLPPGKYELRFHVSYPSEGRDFMSRSLGSLTHEFTMPTETPETTGQPLELGELELKVTELPKDYGGERTRVQGSGFRVQDL